MATSTPTPPRPSFSTEISELPGKPPRSIRLRKLLVIGSTLLILAALAGNSLGSAAGPDENRQRLADLIRRILQQENHLRGLQTQTKGVVEELKKEHAQLATTLHDLQRIEQQISQVQQNISTTQGELAQDRQQLQEQSRAVTQGAVFLYQTGNRSPLEIVLGSHDFLDLLSNLELVERLTAARTHLIDTYERAVQQLDQHTQQLLQERQELVRLQTKRTEEKQHLEGLMDELNRRLEALDSQTTQAQTALNGMERDSLALASLIQQEEGTVSSTLPLPPPLFVPPVASTRPGRPIVSQHPSRPGQIGRPGLGEQTSPLPSGENGLPASPAPPYTAPAPLPTATPEPVLAPAPAPQPIYRYEPFIWPLRGLITQEYGITSFPLEPVIGYTSHKKPIHFHYGIDIATYPGAPIHAAADGRVIRAGYINPARPGYSYGLIVLIVHNNTYSTLYAHLNGAYGLAVGVGDYVHQGDVIGYEGATGWATGPHLHFELRVHGIPTNPRRFLE